jgi:hypothetical protein
MVYNTPNTRFYQAQISPDKWQSTGYLMTIKQYELYN